jgi:methyl-accepting chemotaxis protein
MQMDEMTQQNAALVEEATAASQSMAGQARDLNVMMERYRLAGGAESTGRPVTFSSGEPMLKAVAASPDRRSPKRPFTPRLAKPAVKAASPPPVESKPQKVAGAGGGDDWEEF